MATKDFRKELQETANRLCRPGVGLLAADESTGTIGKKFVNINVENVEANRQRYRELLFTTPGIEKFISGVILFDETARQSTKDGKKFVELLKEKGIIPGIKVDKGLIPIPNTNDETAAIGLEDLAKRCQEYYGMGIRFAKWRAVLKIGNGCPSDLAIQENVWGLARYAAICQANGLCPIVEPEILSDGTHNIEVSQKVLEKVWYQQVKALQENNVFFEGILLKPSMATPGSTNPDAKSVTAAEIAWRTVLALSRTIPPAIPGIMFLSGGQSEEEASLNLNEMNKITEIKRPWSLSFSYGRALQNTCVKTWAGKDENLAAAQKALIDRATAHSEACLGKYAGSKDGSGKESLFVADYKY
jgi:fructose-bisphosphate aldolase class I